MAAKSNYFKESGLHTWHFHSVGKRKSPLAAFGLPPERSCTYKVQLCDLCQGFYRNLRLFWFHQPSHSNKIPILPNSLSKLKPLRRVAFRYDTLAGKFLAMVQLASRRLSLPIILQIILPLGLVVRPAARQLQIEVPILRKNLWILFLHKSKDLFPNQAA